MSLTRPMNEVVGEELYKWMVSTALKRDEELPSPAFDREKDGGAYDTYLRLQLLRGEEKFSVPPRSRLIVSRSGTVFKLERRVGVEMDPGVWGNLPRHILEQCVLPYLPLPLHQDLYQVVGAESMTSEVFQRRYLAIAGAVPPVGVVMGCEYIHLMVTKVLLPWEALANSPYVTDLSPSVGGFQPLRAHRFGNTDLSTFFGPAEGSSRFRKVEATRPSVPPAISVTISSEGLICGVIKFPFRQDIFVMNPIWQSWLLIPKGQQIPDLHHHPSACRFIRPPPMVELDSTSGTHDQFRVVSIDSKLTRNLDQLPHGRWSWVIDVYASASGAWRTVTSQDSYSWLNHSMLFGRHNCLCLFQGKLLCLQVCHSLGYQGMSCNLFTFDLGASDPTEALVDMALPSWVPSRFAVTEGRELELPEHTVIMAEDHSLITDDPEEIVEYLDESDELRNQYSLVYVEVTDYPVMDLKLNDVLALLPHKQNLYAAVSFTVMQDWSVLGISKLEDDGLTWGCVSLLPPTMFRPHTVSSSRSGPAGVPWAVKPSLWNKSSGCIGVVGNMIWVSVEHEPQLQVPDPVSEVVSVRNVWGYHLDSFNSWELLTSDIKQDVDSTYALFEPKALAVILPKDGGPHAATVEAEVAAYTRMMIAREQATNALTLPTPRRDQRLHVVRQKSWRLYRSKKASRSSK